jgi:hypothetical protein
MTPDEVWDPRECAAFIERIPGLAPVDHFDYKMKRDSLGNAYDTARRSIVIAVVSVMLSVLGLVLGALS